MNYSKTNINHSAQADEDSRRMKQLAVIEAKLNAKQEELQHYEALLHTNSKTTWCPGKNPKTNAAVLVGVLEKIQFGELDAILSEGLKNPEIIRAKRKELHRYAESLIKRATSIAKCSPPEVQSEQRQNIQRLRSPQHTNPQLPQHNEESDSSTTFSESDDIFMKEKSDSSDQVHGSDESDEEKDSNDKPFRWMDQVNRMHGFERQRRKPRKRMDPFEFPGFNHAWY